MTNLPYVASTTENYLRECLEDLEEFLQETCKDRAYKRQQYLILLFKQLSKDLEEDLKIFYETIKKD